MSFTAVHLNLSILPVSWRHFGDGANGDLVAHRNRDALREPSLATVPSPVWTLRARVIGPEAAYACRNVRMGSTFAARAAGIHAASRHTATIRPRLAR